MKGKDFFDINFFLQSDTRPLFYQFIAELKESCAKAEPTPTHHYLRDLAKEGRLTRWYTQNIDCLEERLGLNCWNSPSSSSHHISQSTVVSLHGTLSQVSCTLCKVSVSFTEEHLINFKTGQELPCKSCTEAATLRESLGRRKLRSGFLRPDIVLYNEPHPHGETIADFVSSDISKQPNLLIIMGTSLKIAGLKKMIKDFAKSMKSRVGGEKNLIVYVNKTPCSRAEWQGIFDYELIGECDQWINFLGDEYRKVKRFPGKTERPVDYSKLIPSSPIKFSQSSSQPSSSPLHKKPKKPEILVLDKKEAVAVKPAIPTTTTNTKSSAIITSSKKSVKTAVSVSSTISPSKPSQRIDQFFTPVKSAFTPRLNGKKDKTSNSTEKNQSEENKPARRIIKNNRTSGLAM